MNVFSIFPLPSARSERFPGVQFVKFDERKKLARNENLAGLAHCEFYFFRLGPFTHWSDKAGARVLTLAHTLSALACVDCALQRLKKSAVSMALIFSAMATTKNWSMVVSSAAAIRLEAALCDSGKRCT